MTTNELFTKITSVKLWYKGHYTRQNASMIISRHAKGLQAEQFYTKFFAKFGYVKDEISWKQIINKL